MSRDSSEGAETDREVAEKVMGWRESELPGGSRVWADGENETVFSVDSLPFHRPTWSPSTRIDHAWLVVAELQRCDYGITISIEPGSFDVQVCAGHDKPIWAFEAKTAPLAICRAALAAVKPQ